MNEIWVNTIKLNNNLTVLSYLRNLGLIALVSLAINAEGQTCCTGAAPITGAVRVAGLDANQWQFTFSYDYNNISELLQDNVNLNDDYLSRTTTTLLLQSSYGFGKGFGISVLIPIAQHFESALIGTDKSTLKNTDLGDITIFGQWQIPLNTSASLLFGAAIKLPTGETKARDQNDLFVLPPTLQAGTGSYDYIFLAQGQKSMQFRKSLVIQQSFTYRLNTLSTNFASHDNYQFGNEFYAITTFADQIVTGILIHTPSLSMNIRYAGKNTVEQFVDPNSGGWWINLRPGWGVNLTPKLNLSLIYELPIYRNLNGFQLTTSYRVIGVVNFTL
jgi:hypothetical protein